MKKSMLVYAVAMASLAIVANRPATAADQYQSNRADQSDRSSRRDAGAMNRGDSDSSSYDRSGSSKSTMSDSMITAKVKAALLAEPSLKSSGINVQTYNGVVQLNGFVPTQDDIDRAASAAGDVKDVKSVKNNLQVR